MARRTLEILGIQGSGAVGSVVALCPMGLDYLADNWYNTNAASTPGDISEVREQLNSDIVRLYSGTNQDTFNQFDRMLAFDATGAPTTGSALRIPQEMVGMLTPAAQYSTTRNTLSMDKDTGKMISQRRMSITQASGNAWRFFCEVDDATEGGPGAITRVLSYTPTVAAGEASLFQQIPFGTPERRFFRRGFFTASAGNFLSGDFRIVRGNGNEEIFRRPKRLNDQICGDFLKRTPVTTSSVYELDTTETGMPEMFDTMAKTSKGDARAVQMGNDFVAPTLFDLRPYLSLTCNLASLVETFGRL